MPLVNCELHWLSPLPLGSKDEGERLVVIGGEEWRLVASRLHPTTGVLNGLVRSMDGTRAGVVPMGELGGTVKRKPGKAKAASAPSQPPSNSSPLDAAAWSLAAAFDGAAGDVESQLEQLLQLPAGVLGDG